MNDPETQIRRLRHLSNEAIAARDADQVVAFMEPDVRVGVAGGPMLEGRAASRQAFADQFSERGFGGYVREAEQIVVRDPPVSATERGRWTGRWQTSSGMQVQRGRYSAEWRLSAMGWLIASEEYRTSA